jgi:hypothetical protein
LREVMLIFCPTKAFNKVDLPILGLPTNAIVPHLNIANPLALGATDP